MPSVAWLTNSAGTSPIVTTSLRQSWLRISVLGSVGNIRSNCHSGMGTCVPRAGITSTRRDPKYSCTMHVSGPAMLLARVKSGGKASTRFRAPSLAKVSVRAARRSAGERSVLVEPVAK